MKKTKGSNKQIQLLKAAAVILAITAWAAVPLLTGTVKAGGEIPLVVRTATLVSPTGSINPHGAAEWQLYPSGNREIEVEIEDVNLAAGTSLDAIVDGNTIGQLILAADQRGRLKLRTEDGQTVPVTNDGSTVQVKNGATILVAGVFGGGGPNPTPTASPTASPTGSPTGTPTGTPSPSPTGSPPWIFTAYGTFLMRQHFLSTPTELEDAARIDGLGRFGIFRHVALPLARPALATLAVLTLLSSWNSFLEPLIFLSGKTDLLTLPLALEHRHQFDRHLQRVALGCGSDVKK